MEQLHNINIEKLKEEDLYKSLKDIDDRYFKLSVIRFRIFLTTELLIIISFVLTFFVFKNAILYALITFLIFLGQVISTKIAEYQLVDRHENKKDKFKVRKNFEK